MNTEEPYKEEIEAPQSRYDSSSDERPIESLQNAARNAFITNIKQKGKTAFVLFEAVKREVRFLSGSRVGRKRALEAQAP